MASAGTANPAAAVPNSGNASPGYEGQGLLRNGHGARGDYRTVTKLAGLYILLSAGIMFFRVVTENGYIRAPVRATLLRK
jgi:hypothetical protein